MRATASCSYDRGYAAVRVADVVAGANVSRKGFYTAFRDKGEAATEANEVFFQRVLGECASAFFSTSGWPQQVWSGGVALTRALAERPSEAYLGFVEAHSIGPLAVQQVYDRLSAFMLFLEEGYNLNPKGGALPRLFSECIAATMFELAYVELRERRNAERLIELAPQLVYICLAPFIGTRQAAAFVAAPP